MTYSKQTYAIPESSKQLGQASKEISEDKMDVIIDAILEGKYSYACLMTLEATGHEPTQYIPYRTYNRLQKQRQANYRRDRQSASKVSPLRPKIVDIDYVEPVGESEKSVSGGNGHQWNEFSKYNVLYWPE